MKIKPPERIKIISKRFTIEYCPVGTIMLDGDELSGKCITQEQKIQIESDLKSDTQKDTILHEILHAISDEMVLNLTEAQVEGSAKGILAVLIDNPSFARYLVSKEKKVCPKIAM